MSEVKILMIVDDDKDDRFFFKTAVKEIDPESECREAIHGDDALKQLRAAGTLPDFIFMDINMPRMNGIQCLQELKKDERLKDIPVIMYSTSIHDESRDHTEQYGAAYYLVKPADFNDLPAALIVAMEMAMTQTQHE